MVDGTEVWLGMLGFVDDKCLLATSYQEMQSMLHVVEELAKEQCSVYTLPKSVFI